MTLKYKIVAILTPLLVVVDQITKIWVVQNLRYQRDEIEVIPGFLSIIHAQNPGAAMGMLVDSPYRMVIFAVFTVVAVGVLFNMLKQIADDDRFQSVTIALILSGAVGNAIDRVHKQTVTDFIKVYTEYAPLKSWLLDTFRTNEWPTFNVADAAIVVGVALYLVHYLFFERDKAGAEGDVGTNPLEEEKPTETPTEK